jgi:hopene-associated glycosyltransferase HpnB
VVAVVPARDEAANLAHTLPALLAQAGLRAAVLVDDQSTDGTAEVARKVAGDDPRLKVVVGTPPPPGWTGKLWALRQGVREATEMGAELVLLTDADVFHSPGSVSALAAHLEEQDLDLVSVMATLPTASRWERWLQPAFVYFFALLYPFALVGDPRSRVAAAAGGCILVRPGSIAGAGGLEAIRGEVIDDVALARLAKASGGRIWLGLSHQVGALSRGGGLRAIWRTVARSASTQLRHSPALVAGTVAGMALLYLLPPAALVAPPRSARQVAAGAAATCLMAASYLPTLAFYGLPPRQALGLPAVSLLYVAMTLDSACRHWLGGGGSWKGRAVGTRPGPRGSGAAHSPAVGACSGGGA